jgi:lysophospholipid hydrolase
MTLAGYLPPVSENNSLLVDGGYLNAVPADVMRYKMGARTVIACDVIFESERDYFEYGTHLSGTLGLANCLTIISFSAFLKFVFSCFY